MLVSSKFSSHKNKLLIGLLVVLTFLSFSPVLKAQLFSPKDDIYLTQNVSGLLTVLSFSIERHLFGINPLVSHLNNLLLHIAVVVLVFYFTLNLRLEVTVAFLGALIFALHPTKVEAVAWVVQRQEMLYALFYLLSLIAFQKKRLLASLFFGLLSMLSSPEAFSLPLAMILMDWFQSKKISIGTILSKWPYFLMVIVVGTLNYKLYLSWWHGVGSSHPLIDHLFYLPSLIPCLLLAYGIHRLYQFLKSQEAIVRQLFMVAVATLMIGLILLTFNQSLVWKDAVSLWRHQLKVSLQPMVIHHLAEALKNSPAGKATIDERISLYQQAIRLNSDYADSYYHLAILYEDIGKLDDAFVWYNKALAIDSKSKDVLFNLAVLYQKMNKPLLAVETFNRLLKSDPDDENVYLKTIKAYSLAIEENPQEKVYKEQREQVLSDYELLSKRNKYSYLEYFNLGFLYEQVGGHEEARRYYKKSIELKPSYEKSLLNLAKNYQQAGDLKTALLVYQQLLHFHPKNAQGYLNMGIIYNTLGDVDRSRMLYLKAINIDPKNAQSYFYLGYLCESAGEYKDALAYYEKSLENDPKQAEAYYNMGNVYAVLGQEPEAMASYLKTVALDPKHQNAYVNLSILSFKSRDFSGAIQYLEEARLLGYTAPEEYLKSLEPYRKK